MKPNLKKYKGTVQMYISVEMVNRDVQEQDNLGYDDVLYTLKRLDGYKLTEESTEFLAKNNIYTDFKNPTVYVTEYNITDGYEENNVAFVEVYGGRFDEDYLFLKM